jgi:hypothetical protein
MNKPDPATLSLRNQILDACQSCDVNHAAQALVDSLMILLIASAPDEASAERAVRAVGSDMADNIVTSYREYHALRKATRQ